MLSIKEYKKRGINPFLILPWSCNLQFIDREASLLLKDLLKEGIRVYGSSALPRIFSFRLPLRKSLASLLASKDPSIINTEIDKDICCNSHCVVSLHETVDALTTCSRIGEAFSLRRIALLQLPPFYGDLERLKNIEKAHHLWLECIGGPKAAISWNIINWVGRGVSKNMRRLLSSFDLLLAVSRSIPVEMGGDWPNRVVSLDPGVALPTEDVALINKILRGTGKKERIIVFGGRPSAEKGLVEALIALREVVKSCGRDLKLAVTGRISNEALERVKAFCSKLGIKGNVLFYGFLPREERLAIVAKSMVMLYPSHVDAFPYAVLEALHLNTPVVAYDIPALRTYYSGLEGVTLVRELDVEALAQKVIEVIEKKSFRVEKPKISKSWDEIMDEETGIIKSFVYGNASKFCRP